MKVIEIATANVTRSFDLGGGGPIQSIEFDSKGKSVVVSRPGGAFQAIDLSSGAVKMINPAIGWIAEYRFSPDGKYMAAGSQKGIIVWDARTWEEHRRFGEEEVTSRRGYVAFSRDGKLVAAITAAGRLSFWDPATGKLVHQVGEGLNPDGALEFTADGRVLAAGMEGEIKVFGPGAATPAQPGK